MANGKQDATLVAKPQRTVGMSETATASAAAQAEAAVKARFAMAHARPRDWDEVRETFLKDCRRPSLARVALYNKPIGNGVIGPSIRLAETAMRAMGNLDVQTPALYDDEEKRIVRVTVTDLEANLTFSKDVTITKVVERRSLYDGQDPISVRKNSQGKVTFLVAATDDDILNKENALISKAMRTLGLRAFPGELLAEGLDVVRAVLASAAAADPEAEKNRIIDSFGGIGIPVLAIKDFLGHDLDTVSTAELVNLRALYQAIKDGETNWGEVMASRSSTGDGETKAAEKPKPKTLDDLTARLDKPADAPAAAGPVSADEAKEIAAAEKKAAGA